jgi:hypothetical protein
LLRAALEGGKSLESFDAEMSLFLSNRFDDLAGVVLKFDSGAVAPWRSMIAFLNGRRELVFKVVLLRVYCIASPSFSSLLLGALFALIFPSVNLPIAFCVSIGRFFSSYTRWLSLLVLVGLLSLGF